MKKKRRKKIENWLDWLEKELQSDGDTFDYIIIQSAILFSNDNELLNINWFIGSINRCCSIWILFTGCSSFGTSSHGPVEGGPFNQCPINHCPINHSQICQCPICHCPIIHSFSCWSNSFRSLFSCPEQLLKSSCRSVRLSVGPSVRRSVGPSVRLPLWKSDL